MRIKHSAMFLLLFLGLSLAANAQNSDINATINSTDTVRMTINQKRAQRGLVDTRNVFVPRGQWIFGGTASYSTHTNNNYKILIVEDINSTGYTFKVSPLIAYAIGNNMAVGGRFIYSRTLLKIDSASLSFGDGDSGVNLSTDYYYALSHSYSLGAVWRQYIPLGRNRRFALFNEMQLSVGGSEAKYAADQPVRGTFSTSTTIALGVSPGIIAFASNIMAIEVNVGMMGISYSHTKQTHNQVTTGKFNTSYMNFSVNLLSIGLGVSFYM